MKNALNPKILQDLGGGLILRRSSPADAAALAEFNSRIHGEGGKPDTRIGAWTEDMLLRPHPTMGADDFTIVEETASGKIVSSMNLIPQTWRYEGISFGVGRPELVGTDPAYRNRGLVRAQFKVIHEWCRQRNLPVQGITGIPYYYRQFGYAMALNLGGGRKGYTDNLPKMPADQEEPFVIRPAVEEDIPFIAALYDSGMKRQPLMVERPPDIWRYEILGKSPENINRLVIYIIQSRAGEPLGWFAHPNEMWGSMLAANGYELKEGVSWAEVTPCVERRLVKIGAEYARGTEKTCESYGLWLGEDHPAYKSAAHTLPTIRPSYAWYIRIPDLPGFIRTITPALERRLAASAWTGWSGELLLSFYRDGLKLLFNEGRLEKVDQYRPTPESDDSAAFPDLTFLELLFGRRSWEELRYAFPDCWGKSEIADLLDALFPRKPSDMFTIS